MATQQAMTSNDYLNLKIVYMFLVAQLVFVVFMYFLIKCIPHVNLNIFVEAILQNTIVSVLE